ncbi:uncharacterized protein PV09_06593 [Verruconis gallopava]|uniref:Glutaminase A n=1 Tax=Verruconis gallopava TaxID=253628 RepID=A0A0D2A5V0_9PEZI|nr:uncharacterized protein PV09_06593 [Verruconis gallopava]KIW02103.1 hypothetical protein PV09_06593 [Verruconis gallopava]
MRNPTAYALCLVLLISFTSAVSTFQPARPPAIPLAVKSPYLSTWLNAGSSYGNGGYLAGEWPVHWAQKITGWSGFIRVDGQVYQWLGNAARAFGNESTVPNVDQKSFEYTSTQSSFIMDIEGKVQMTVNFLSPITPDDFKRQSLPMSYMEVSVVSTDGAQHSIQLYADISAEWASGTPDATAQWETGEINNIVYHKIWRQTQIEFDESDKPSGNGMAEWGNVYWATDSSNSLTIQTGSDTNVRSTFIKMGKLDGSQDSNFRAINNNWPVFGFARDFGNVGMSVQSQLFTIGLLQQNAVQFLGANGLVKLPSLWVDYFQGNELDALSFFHLDYVNQQEKSSSLDASVKQASTSVAGDDYNTITSLSVRQAFGALELVGTQSKMYLFMKEISSNGNTQTVDVVFPLHPIITFLNPQLMKLLLDPLYENQESGHYPNKWSIHDLGTHFPNATGHPDGLDESMPVEECGNMLIMTLAYAQKTGDYAYLSQHYPILTQWTEFLIEDSLIPATQLSTDDFAGSLQNQTNLALKGIIGIRAMGEIAKLAGNADDEKKYNDIATSYITQWQSLGISYDTQLPHTTLNYGNNQTHGLLYNLWCDLELGLNLVPQSVYEMQSKFYPSVKEQYGVPLDTRHSYTKVDWEMFTAACCSQDTRDMFIKDLSNWIGATDTGRPFTDLYDTLTGSYPDIMFVARPTVGGTFALLIANALNNSPKLDSSGAVMRQREFRA